MEHRPRFRQDRKSQWAALRDRDAGGHPLSTLGSSNASRQAKPPWSARQRSVYSPFDLPSTANSESMPVQGPATTDAPILPEDTNPFGHLPSSIGRLSLKSSGEMMENMGVDVFGESVASGRVKREKRLAEYSFMNGAPKIQMPPDPFEEEEEDEESEGPYLPETENGLFKTRRGGRAGLPPAPKLDMYESSPSREESVDERYEHRRQRLARKDQAAIRDSPRVDYDSPELRFARGRSPPFHFDPRNHVVSDERQRVPSPSPPSGPALLRKQSSLDTFDRRTRGDEYSDDEVYLSKSSSNDLSGVAFITGVVSFTISKDSSADEGVRQAKLLADMGARQAKPLADMGARQAKPLTDMGERSQRIRRENETESTEPEPRVYMEDADDDGNPIDDTKTYVSVIPPSTREAANVSRRMRNRMLARGSSGGSLRTRIDNGGRFRLG